MLKSSASPVTIKTAEPDMVNPDEWYNNKLKGAGGQDDSHLPDGSKSLSQLMAQSSLGKDSGYSRLGADLLFEYNKAVMKKFRQAEHASACGADDEKSGYDFHCGRSYGQLWFRGI